MATVKCDDGSELVLTEEEFLLYLKATGKIVPPKSQAEIIAEKMREVAEASRPVIQMSGTATVPSAPEPQTPTLDIKVVDTDGQDLKDARDEAEAIQGPVEIGDFVIMPGNRLLPKHVTPGGIPPRPQRRIPVTKNEWPVIKVLKEAYPEPLTTMEITQRLGHDLSDRPRITCILSALFTSERGIKKGPKKTWILEIWAYRAQWFIDGTPSRRWPPKEGDNAP